MRRIIFMTALIVVLAGCGPKKRGDASPECEEYCTLMQDNCPTTVFENFEECADECAFYDSEPEDLDPETGVAPNDDTLECRLYHANNASAGTDGVHCAHASPEGGGVCVAEIPPCGDYCGSVVEFCEGTDGVPNTDVCLEQCNGLLRGMEGDADGNTAHCLFTWAQRAKMNQDTSLCPNASFESPVCVD